MQSIVRSCASVVLALWLAAAAAGAEQPGSVSVSFQHHPWGRFEPGAWKLVRVTTQTLDEQGLVASTSTSETRTTLLAVEKDGVVLEVEATVEVAGKHFAAEPQVIKQGFHGEPSPAVVQAEPAQAGQVVLEGQPVACWVQQFVLQAPGAKTVVTLYFSDQVAPYLLKRTSTTTDPQTGQTLAQTQVEIIARHLPWKVRSEIKPCVLIRTTRKHAKGTVVTWTLSSSDVPGSVVAHSSKELDAEGRVVRRSVLELVDYGSECPAERPGLFGHRRRPRPSN